MILGEPQSGKSELLKNCDLDLHSAANLESSVTAALPLNCWIGPKTFIPDVSGRVFFDRWLEGSSAEWDYLIKLIKKQHSRRPLDGVLLAIPADALISDDVELTKQKAALIGSELHQLLSRSGMNLPCHVLVTKIDMLLGFREYFSAYTEEDRKVEMINLLAAHQGKFNRNTKDILAQIIYHYDYIKAQQMAFDHYLKPLLRRRSILQFRINSTITFWLNSTRLLPRCRNRKN